MRKPFTYTFGELIDKLTIISKKDLCGLPGARQELNTIMHWMEDLLADQAYLLLAVIRVTQANADIWHLEHAMRNANVGEMPLHVIGRNAERIRDINKTRVRYKNELDSACGARHVEEKLRHLSEEIYNKFYKENGLDAEQA